MSEYSHSTPKNGKSVVLFQINSKILALMAQIILTLQIEKYKRGSRNNVKGQLIITMNQPLSIMSASCQKQSFVLITHKA